MATLRILFALIFTFLVSCAGEHDPGSSPTPLVEAPPAAPPPYDDEPVVNEGDAGPDQDAGSSQVDASMTPKVDASISPDAAVVSRDGSVPDANVPDANVSRDASLQPDAGGVVVIPTPPTNLTPYLRRACTTAADCMEPFRIIENNAFTTICLPRPGYDSPGEQPLCVIKAGATTGRCSFYCTDATSYYPDQNRWCQGFNAPCLSVPTGTACLLAGLL